VDDVLRINGTHGHQAEDRFSRFGLISWWDQQRLGASKALVIGAGALGNEIAKNLALLGVGHMLIADLDRVELSNLSRSVLFRGEDRGRMKADVAAARVKEIYPGVQAAAFCGNIVYDLGLGVFRWADVILAGLDNREARVAVNQAAAKAGRPWFDGAIERLSGVARVFDPATGPCYECTMNATDWDLLRARRSCALLSRQEMEEGKVPTTPTTASIIAAIQCQEAVKYLHGLDTIAGQGYVFEGLGHQSYLVSYTRSDQCPSHDPMEAVHELDASATTLTARQLLERARADLGPAAVIDLNQDVLESLACEACATREQVLSSLGTITEDQGRCPRCGAPRTPTLFHTITGHETFLDRPLAQIGVPRWDILTGRSGDQRRHYELSADRAGILAPMSAAAPARPPQPTGAS
jgi:molybdopterin/thiamine biosynthesis adenylyltransferase